MQVVIMKKFLAIIYISTEPKWKETVERLGA